MIPSYYETRKSVRPLIIVNDLSLFPGQVAHFDIGGSESVHALEWAERENGEVLVITLRADAMMKQGGPTTDDLFSMGTIATIRQSFRIGNGRIKLLAEGQRRAHINALIRQEPYYEAEVVEYLYHPEKVEIDDKFQMMLRLTSQAALAHLRKQETIPEVFLYALVNTEDPGRFSDEIAPQLDLQQDEAEELLTELDLVHRVERLYETLQLLTKLSSLEDELNERATERMNQSQKEYMLREQMQIIRDELGEDPFDPDTIEAQYRERIEALPMPDDSKSVVLKEVERLSYLPPSSPEISVTRAYLDTVLDLPWGVYTKDFSDLERSQKILDKRHYGLTEVKERILEFIAVRKLRGDSKGSILCLVGPPGVGKTSVARSIAEALNREFISMRLGGMSDESEIRGHRRTYVGSMPGRIITHMTKCRSMNPVFLMDEIDKVGNDYRGDPASALLEVLDPEQNREFADRYLEIPFDLSQVMFVTTANTVDTIPSALLDRLEIISISGYTEFEKYEIARKYLIPKQREACGLTGKDFVLPAAALKEIIRNYTRESGVRELERQIGTLCRKVARNIVEGGGTFTLGVKTVQFYLKKPVNPDESLVDKPQVGVVNGLAWTETGGEILQIEANIMQGHGGVQLTGSLGNVMKESALAAISYVRANAKRFGIDEAFHENTDIHIHLPEGAVPKDGPSAGISMLTAVVSALTHRPVRNDIAMTGEMTLTGRVLPVGGIKEKILAAHRYRLKKVFLPKDPSSPLAEIPSEVMQDIRFVEVSHVDEVLAKALLAPVEEKRPIVFAAEESPTTMGFVAEQQAPAETAPTNPSRKSAKRHTQIPAPVRGVQ